MRGGPAGDLYIFLSVRPHEFFQRDGADLFCKVPVSMTTAAMGGEIEVPTIDGKKARVTIPEGTQTGKQFRLKGKGMPVLRSSQSGDMYIQVTVETPVNLSRRQRELLQASSTRRPATTAPSRKASSPRPRPSGTVSAAEFAHLPSCAWERIASDQVSSTGNSGPGMCTANRQPLGV